MLPNAKNRARKSCGMRGWWRMRNGSVSGASRFPRFLVEITHAGMTHLISPPLFRIGTLLATNQEPLNPIGTYEAMWEGIDPPTLEDATPTPPSPAVAAPALPPRNPQPILKPART